MNGARVLVIDDEPDFRRLIEEHLTGEGFQVIMAEDGREGVSRAREALPDLILLDWNLPGQDGTEVCRILKSDPKTQDIPILMLTVRGRETDTVLALGLGACDFISKRALRPRELAARLQVALRKGRPSIPTPELIRYGPLTLDTTRRRVTLSGTPVELRPKEFDLLHAFMKRPGHVLTRAFLTESIWGDQYFGSTRTIDTTLARVRAKLGPFGDRLQSIKGIGYVFDERER
ncbi:MAG: response regulator transcription factor [Elusimicrobia bacterium]|nr:response regulator transcription factor [Elusimicrobiota bacterium]